MSPNDNPLSPILQRMRGAAGRRPCQLVAVSKKQSAAAIRALATLGQRDFGENYVQEALAKQSELTDLDLCWHMIGPLQSNKCKEVAQHFDWVQSVDREKLITGLSQARRPQQAPLNVLIQVNISDEDSKSGCLPDAVLGLAEKIAGLAQLRLRGLMAIPAPWEDSQRRIADIHAMRAQFDLLQSDFESVDTLSMGMSDDFELALREGATMVRIGSALFGARAA